MRRDRGFVNGPDRFFDDVHRSVASAQQHFEFEFVPIRGEIEQPPGKFGGDRAQPGLGVGKAQAGQAPHGGARQLVAGAIAQWNGAGKIAAAED
jgi:hypothetical protein